MPERPVPFVFDENYGYLKDISNRAPRFPYNWRYAAKAYQEIFFPLGLKPGQTMLDVGCCLGNLGHYFHFAGIDTIGIDLNMAALRQGRTLWSKERNQLLQADAGFLPFKNASFDHVVSQDVLEHMPDENTLEKVFSEMTRVLAGNRMYHKITVAEDTFCIDADPSHFLKWPSQKWREWFEDKGWKVTAPTTRNIFSWKQKDFIRLHGFFLIEKNTQTT